MEVLALDWMVQAVSMCLDPPSVVKLALTNKKNNERVLESNFLKWLSEVQNIRLGPVLLGDIEMFQIVHSMKNVKNCIRFDWGEYDIELDELSDDVRSSLISYERLLKTHMDLTISIEGHCGIEFPGYLSGPISLKRAENIARILVECGIEEDRIKTTGFGKTKLLVEAYGPRDGRPNRRVDIYLIHKKSPQVSIPVRRDPSSFVENPLEKSRSLLDRFSLFDLFPDFLERSIL